MFIDASLEFSPFAPVGTPQSLAVTTSTASSSIIDITGAGSGNTPSVSFGNASVFGSDMGIGDGAAVPSVYALITTTAGTTNSATLNIALQSAPDNGSNAPGTWSTVSETGAIAASALTAGTAIKLPFGQRAPGAALPRFYRLFYQLPAATTFTAGAISAGVVIGADSSLQGGQYPSAFTAV